MNFFVVTVVVVILRGQVRRCGVMLLEVGLEGHLRGAARRDSHLSLPTHPASDSVPKLSEHSPEPRVLVCLLEVPGDWPARGGLALRAPSLVGVHSTAVTAPAPLVLGNRLPPLLLLGVSGKLPDVQLGDVGGGGWQPVPSHPVQRVDGQRVRLGAQPHLAHTNRHEPAAENGRALLGVELLGRLLPGFGWNENAVCVIFFGN